MPAASSFSADTENARPIHAITPQRMGEWAENASVAHRRWAEAAGFSGQAGQTVVLPGSDGQPEGALFGLGDTAAQRRARFAVASLATSLPAGPWRFASGFDAEQSFEAALGWQLAGYRFDRYAAASEAKATLVAPEGVDAERVLAMARAETITRDLINTPARDMGPAQLEQAVRELADRHDAAFSVTEGTELAEGFPLIEAVGQAAAADRAPRLLELRHGEAGPRVTLVGKGVCFDTGGLNLKPGSSMSLMKKDMGGAATVLGLAQLLMEMQTPIRLRVLIPAVENAVSGAAFRPGDILPSRKGLTVEVNNTDAEGRLVLADALALASEEETDLLVSMATLTGAARVAVGPDLAPFYTDDDAFADSITEGGVQGFDPVWRMPFWEPYESMIEPGIADLDNAPKGGFAGSITAALFLRRFVTAPRYAHFDIYGWQPSAAPGRPKGGAGQGARALFAAIEALT